MMHAFSTLGIGMITFTMVATGCASSQEPVNPDASHVTSLDHAQLSRIMREKTEHSSRLIGALSTGNFEAVDQSASRLYYISEESSWLTHETVAYTALSESFRRIALELASNARAKNLSACESTYLRLTESCIKCHKYLRDERAKGNLPGRITKASPEGHALASGILAQLTD